MNRRPSLALVISILALVVAMGGTSYAVTQLPKNSVGAAQLKKGAVTEAKIAPKVRADLRGVPTFGATVTSQGGALVGCGPTMVLTLPLVVTSRSRILASAAGTWLKTPTYLYGYLMAVLLRDDVVVAQSPIPFVGTTSGGQEYLQLSVDAVLGLPGDTTKVSTAYVAKPGDYTLELRGSQSGNSGCAADSQVLRPQLTYVLLDTKP